MNTKDKDTKTKMLSIEVDMAKRRLLFFHCGSLAEMEQVAAQRLA